MREKDLLGMVFKMKTTEELRPRRSEPKRIQLRELRELVYDSRDASSSSPLGHLQGLLRSLALDRPTSVDEMNDAIAIQVAEDDERIRSGR